MKDNNANHQGQPPNQGAEDNGTNDSRTENNDVEHGSSKTGVESWLRHAGVVGADKLMPHRREFFG